MTFDESDMTVAQAAPTADYTIALEAVAPNVTQLVEETRSPGESWIDSLARLLPVLAATDQQRKILQIQTERARQGLPPLDASQYGVGVNVGLSSDTKQLMGYALAGVALLVVPMLLKRR